MLIIVRKVRHYNFLKKRYYNVRPVTIVASEAISMTPEGLSGDESQRTHPVYVLH